LVAVATMIAAGLMLVWAAGLPPAHATSNPVIRSIAPTSGGGGTGVTIEGEGFMGGATVLFGATPSEGVLVLLSTSISAKAPAGLTGPVAITVINPDGGRASVADAFIYGRDSDYLTVKGVTPASGPAAGGTNIVVTGTGFSPDANVYIGGVLATRLLATGSTLSVRTPAHVPGTVDITVTNPDGRSVTLPRSFGYGGAAVTTPLLPPQGFAVFVFGGTSNDLVAAAGCGSVQVAFWAIDQNGGFIAYVPAAVVGAVNAAWNAKFATGIPAGTALIGRCG
jgi:hypothetical protein